MKEKWQLIPWSSLANRCIAAGDEAVETYLAQDLEKHEISKIDSSWDSESGPNEGSDEGRVYYPPSKLQQLRVRLKSNTPIVTSFCEHYNIKAIAMEILPQLTRLISEAPLVLMSGKPYPLDRVGYGQAYQLDSPSGLIDGHALYNYLFTNDLTLKGIYYFLMHDTRSDYLDTQYKQPWKSYSSLVPTVLHAFKVIKGIPYSHWNPAHIAGLVHPSLSDAMLYDGDAPSIADIVNARQVGLSVKSGTSKGSTRNAATTYKLWGTTTLSHLPRLAQVMYSQIWLAHPQNRTNYMILDPKSWDTMPSALISEDLLDKHSYVPKAIQGSTESW